MATYYDSHHLMIKSTHHTMDTTIIMKDALILTHPLYIMVNPLMVIQTLKITDRPEFIRWSDINTRHFTVQSAYNLY